MNSPLSNVPLIGSDHLLRRRIGIPTSALKQQNLNDLSLFYMNNGILGKIVTDKTILSSALAKSRLVIYVECTLSFNFFTFLQPWSKKRHWFWNSPRRWKRLKRHILYLFRYTPSALDRMDVENAPKLYGLVLT